MDLVEFYFNYCLMFSNRYEIEETKFLFSKFVSDNFSNIAIVGKSFNLKLINKEFKKHNLNPVLYSFNNLEMPSFKKIYSDDWLEFKNISNLYKKYHKLKSSNIELVEVINIELENEYKKVNDMCYGTISCDNPYSGLDNNAYCNCVFDFKKNETQSATLIYLIKFKNQFIGCINITISNGLAYISGLAIANKFRRTYAFLSMVNVLEILLNNNVSNVFCITELNDYPDKLYKKIGFKSVGVAHAYEKISL